jgi:hypothetical protein
MSSMQVSGIRMPSVSVFPSFFFCFLNMGLVWQSEQLYVDQFYLAVFLIFPDAIENMFCVPSPDSPKILSTIPANQSILIVNLRHESNFWHLIVNRHRFCWQVSKDWRRLDNWSRFGGLCFHWVFLKLAGLDVTGVPASTRFQRSLAVRTRSENWKNVHTRWLAVNIPWGWGSYLFHESISQNKLKAGSKTFFCVRTAVVFSQPAFSLFCDIDSGNG